MNKEDSFQLEIVLITRDFENLLISPKPNITSQFLKSEVLIVYAVRQTWAGLASRVSGGLSQVISDYTVTVSGVLSENNRPSRDTECKVLTISTVLYRVL